MKNLQHKYREGKLSSKELSFLREKVNSSTDETLADELRDVWLNEDMDTSKIDSAQFDKLKERIDREIKLKQQPSYSFMKRVVQIAVAVLLPVFFLATLYLHDENNRLASSEINISTGVGERVSLILPDGTNVTLNAESNLTYVPQTYNKKKRQIFFEGEAYFQVAKDEKHPFEIDARGLNVKVLGTTFNLLARENYDKAELALEEGSVSFLSTSTGKNVILRPHQKAVLNRMDGEISVFTEPEIKDASAWKRNQLVFRNVPFLTLLKSVEENYNVKIETDYQADPADLFTGTIPSANINEVLEIIEKTYHLKAYMEGEKIELMID